MVKCVNNLQISNLCPQIHSDLFSGSGHDIFAKSFQSHSLHAALMRQNLNFMELRVVFFCFFQGQPTNSMGSELTSDNSKLHGHTNEHVQFEGAHQEINRSLLPCRHTDNDKCIGILGMHPCFY